MTFEKLSQLVTELYEWMQAKKAQQITAPLDEASRASIGAATGQGAGSTALTQSITINAVPATFSVPHAYTGTIILSVDGVKYEIPYLSTP